MENSGQGSKRRGLGPRPDRRGFHARARLSASRRALLEMLDAQPEPTTLAALALMSGLHENTVRGHLDALERDGLVTRERAEPKGRGRPAWVWTASGGDGPSEYARLVSVLVDTLNRTSEKPRVDAEVAGMEWGRDLARSQGLPDDATSTDVRRQMVRLLDGAGFAPEPDGEARRVRLTRCPLLEAARVHTGVVCGVHLGLVRGALEEYGASSGHATLTPFAEPGACILRLGTP